MEDIFITDELDGTWSVWITDSPEVDNGYSSRGKIEELIEEFKDIPELLFELELIQSLEL